MCFTLTLLPWWSRPKPEQTDAIKIRAVSACQACVTGLFDTKSDVIALLLVLAAALALWRLKWGVVAVIAASGLAGLLLRWLGLA